jgi:hypothetical protein
MIINIIVNNIKTIEELMNLININVVYISRKTIWCEGFYIKLLDDMLEINVFNKNITKQYILDVLVKPILDGREQTFIRIQKGRINIQFIVHKNETIECVYN